MLARSARPCRHPPKVLAGISLLSESAQMQHCLKEGRSFGQYCQGALRFNLEPNIASSVTG